MSSTSNTYSIRTGISAFHTKCIISALLMGITIYLLAHNIWASVTAALSVWFGLMAIGNGFDVTAKIINRNAATPTEK